MSKNQKYFKWLGVFPIPALLVILGAQSAYWFNAIAGNWPPTIILFLIGIVVGTFSLSCFQFGNAKKRVIFIILYGALLTILLWGLVFLTACANGDCI